MLEHLTRFWRTSVIGTFLTGVLFLLPVALTIYIVAWIIDFMRGQLGPGTLLGRLLTSVGGGIIGQDQNTLAFWLGLLIALVGIWCLGIIVKTQAKSMIQENIDSIFARVPLIRSIYSPVSRVVRLATKRDGGDFSGMAVVTCRFGGPGGVDILALLASRDVYLIGGERRRLVYLPTAPIPMSGGLVLVPEHAVIPVPEMKVDDLLKVYVSLGALAPETFPANLVASAAAPLTIAPASTSNNTVEPVG
jgi:uncharacterized membrane protein